MANLNDIFNWFSIGRTPTAQQFKDTFSSFFHKSEKFPLTQVQGLNDNLNKLETEKAERIELMPIEANIRTLQNTKAERSELANIQGFSIRKTYDTEVLMNADVANPISTDNTPILSGQLVAVKDKAMYSYVTTPVKKWEFFKTLELPDDAATKLDLETKADADYIRDYKDITDTLNLSHGWWSGNGLQPNENWRCVIFPITKDDKIRVSAKISGGSYLAKYRDAANNLIGQEVAGTIPNVYDDYDLTIPENAAFILLNGETTHPFVVKKYLPTDTIKRDEIKPILPLPALLEDYVKQNVTIKNGFYFSNGDWNATTSGNWRGIELTVKDTDEIKVNGTTQATSTQLALYKNKAGAVIGVEQTGLGSMLHFKKYKLTIPVGTVTVCLSTNIGADGDYPFEVFVKQTTAPAQKSEIENLPLIEKALQDYVKQNVTLKNGFYFSDGNFNPSTGDSWRSIELTGVSELDEIKVNGTSSATATQLALYKNKVGAVIGVEQRGTGAFTVFTKYKLNIPVGTATICLTSSIGASGQYPFEVYKIGLSAPAKPTDIVNLQNQIDSLKLITDSYWKGKKIWWCGTSIPECGYPQLVAAILGAMCTNVALGSSPIRAGRPMPYAGQNTATDPYGWKDRGDIAVRRAFCQTLEEKQYMIDNWSEIRKILPSSIVTLSEADKQDILNSSFERKLLPYLDHDLFVFDHGYNDILGLSMETTEAYQNVPANSRDRNTFIGATNFLIDLILRHNPRARFVFIGHYSSDNGLPMKNVVCKAQENLAAYWNAPILKLWEHTRWSQQKVITTGYWTNEPDAWARKWISSGGAEREMTLTEIWMADNIHPHSEPAKQYLASIMANWLNGVR